MKRLLDEPIYFSSKTGKLNKYGKSAYNKPILFYATISALSGSADIMAFGERIYRMSKVLLNKSDEVNEGDIVYAYGATPDKDTINGEHANYKVVAVLPQHIKKVIYIERII